MLNHHQTGPDKRRSLYTFGDYNPYLPSPSERPLVEENLARLRSGDISLRKFLKQTPHFPRWREEQIDQARILLVVNEPGLSGIDKLYGGLVNARSSKEVAEHFHAAMVSWLSLTDHPLLNEINGEPTWAETAPWQETFPRLARCGKAGYFMAPDEEELFACAKVLHMELSPFPQTSGREPNPRNDQDVDYHRENLETLQKFIKSATAAQPRHIFIIGNRASIRCTGINVYRLEATRSMSKDRSNKIGSFLRVAQSRGEGVKVRICRQWPLHGRDAEILELIRATAYELRPVERQFL